MYLYQAMLAFILRKNKIMSTEIYILVCICVFIQSFNKSYKSWLLLQKHLMIPHISLGLILSNLI